MLDVTVPVLDVILDEVTKLDVVGLVVPALVAAGIVVVALELLLVTLGAEFRTK